VAYGIRRADDLAAVVAFFEARNGRLHGFPLQGLGRLQILPAVADDHPTDQSIGTGNGSDQTFQLVKRYTSGAQSGRGPSPSRSREPSASRWAWSSRCRAGRGHHHRRRHLHHRPGRRRHHPAGFEFDVPVRFDTDMLDVTLDFERLGSITSIPLWRSADEKPLPCERFRRNAMPPWAMRAAGSIWKTLRFKGTARSRR
jgi:hypothetical protein